MRYKLLMCACALCSVSASAQDIYSDALSGSLAVYRDPARQASTGVDAAINNPAGTAFIAEGLHLSGGISSAVAFERVRVSNFPIYDSKDSRYNIGPILQAVWRKGDVALSFAFSRDGGYGRRKLTYSPYCSISHSNYSEIDALLSAANGIVAQYMPYAEDSLNDKVIDNIHGGFTSVYNWGLYLGASYRILDSFSVYGGIKTNRLTTMSKYWHKASILSRDQYFISWESYISSTVYNISTYEPDEESELRPMPNDIKQEVIADYMSIPEPEPSSRQGIKQTAGSWSFSPVVGIDIHTPELNIGAKYEFGSIAHSGRQKLPAQLSAGMAWRMTPSYGIAAGTDIFFSDKQADERDTGLRSDKSATYNISASLTYYYQKEWELCAGLTCSHQWFMLPEVEMITCDKPKNVPYLSMGFAYKFNRHIQFNGGLRTALYSTKLHSPDNTAKYSVTQPIQFAFGLNLFFDNK